MRLFLLLLLIFASLTSSLSETFAATPVAQAYDVVIYGPTSAGIAAAVQIKKMGKTVVVVGPDKHLGGLSAGGLGWTDSGNKAVIGGVSRDFYARVKQYYDDQKTWKWQQPKEYSRYRAGDDAQWTFEPHIAEKVFEDWVREYKIPVVREEYLDRENGVELKDGEIVSIKMLSGKQYAGRIFMDATYEGDLMAAAGVSYAVGREANSRYGETLNGVQMANARSHQFSKPIDPYVTPGDPSSGLLPRIQEGGPGEEGAGDHRVQAYCFRVCLTRNPENRVPFSKPEGYDAAQYELLFRSVAAGSRHFRGKFDMLPNLKTDTNNHGSFSTDNIGMNYDYPDASYERRREIVTEHRSYQQGYFYFLTNDPRLPDDVRSWMSQWGLAKDEFLDNAHWPHQIYVREARRMVSDFVITENHLRRKKPTPRSIGMGSYNMDSHNVQRYVDAAGRVRNEGDIQVNPGGPYPIDYGAVIPNKEECTNLLVPVCVSSSHIAFGSIRMEPVFMILGQSCATAAVMAIDGQIPVQDVDYDQLRKRLEAEGQVLEYTGGRRGATGIDSKKLPGIVIDDTEAKRHGKWISSQANTPFVSAGYLHDGAAQDGRCKVVYSTTLPKKGNYKVRLIYPANTNRATNTRVMISHAAGEEELTVDQQTKPRESDGFMTLGVYEFVADRPATVTISNDEADGHVIADAVQFLPQ